MQSISPTSIRQLLDNQLSDSLGIHAWVGFANNLFLGFGIDHTDIIRSQGPPPRPIPGVQLHCANADWTIHSKGRQIVSSSAVIDPNPVVNQMVGHKTTRLHLSDKTHKLSITLADNYSIRIWPYESSIGGDELAWSFRVDDQYCSAFCSGALRSYGGHERTYEVGVE